MRMVNNVFVVALCPLFFGTMFSTTVDSWTQNVTDDKVTIGHYFHPTTKPAPPVKATVNFGISGSVESEFPRPTYTLGDFCAGTPIPHNFAHGLGMGDLGQLESRREELCASGPAAAAPQLPSLQEIQDEASQILDAGEIVVDPADAKILVNKPTYYFSTVHDISTSVEVSGYSIPISAHPVSFEWDFGDGTGSTTSSPGGYWPDGDVQHPYLQPGQYTPKVKVYWSISIQLPGSGWTTLPEKGKTTATGPQLDVVNAYGVLTLPF